MAMGSVIKALIQESELTASECGDIFVALLHKPEVLGGKMWTTEDLHTVYETYFEDNYEMEEKEVEELVNKALDYVNEDALCDCEDGEWEVLYNAMEYALRGGE